MAKITWLGVGRALALSVRCTARASFGEPCNNYQQFAEISSSPLPF